jgi:hypothetical protein
MSMKHEANQASGIGGMKQIKHREKGMKHEA